VRFIRANESDIKREVEEGASGVRVMTVHGAKGLEADVVFLADTGGAIVIPSQRDILVAIGKDRDDPAFLWRRRKEEAPEVQRRADAIADMEKEQEYLRLLYVAMTRARDVLYVAGVRLLNVPKYTWYTVVRDALIPSGGSEIELDEDGELKNAFQWPRSPRPPLGAEVEVSTKVGVAAAAPDWLHRAASTPPSAPQPLRPSSGLAEPDPLPAGASARMPDEAALIRGRTVHLLLQFLPSLPQEARAAAAERLLKGELADAPDLARAVREETDAVLAHPDLADLFAGESRAEVAIVGSVETPRGKYAVSGRIDRLLRNAAGWHLVDFKTDRAVPASLADVDPAYVLQMALYRRLLTEMEPGATVAAKLVYTAGPNVMPIPNELMEKALDRLGIRANPVP
jgi:ATP-dependent helicase/nuclease subunit A